ncbi:hypothetical protein ACFLZB_03455 [Nanoarchaeota archaeon]
MFKFLKGLFKSEETEETVEEDNLLFWFDKKVKDKLKNLDKEIDTLFNGVEKAKVIISGRANQLDKAEIKDPDKVEDRIRNVVVGHKNNYLRTLNIFLNGLDLPEKRTLSEAMKFNDWFKERLDELAKSTAKSYAASQHLFFNEVEQLAKELKGLAALSSNFEKVIEKNKLKEIDMVRMIVDLFYKKSNEKAKLTQELKLKQERFDALKLSKQKKLQEIESLEQGKDHQDYLELKNKKESLDSQIRENQSKFLQIFAQLERSLRKIEHSAESGLDLIRTYLENPIEAFFKDNELFFMKIIDQIKNDLAKESLDLKDSKREKTLEVVHQVSENSLREIQHRNNQLQEERVVLNKKIDNNFVSGKLSDLRYRLEHVDTQIADLEQEVKEVEELLSKIDLGKIKDKIVEKVFEVFGVKLSFKSPEAPLQSSEAR